MTKELDPLMSVHTLASTKSPQQLVWLAAHQDYNSRPVHNTPVHNVETIYGERVVQMLLAGGRGHYGCFEHPQITFNWSFVPHSAIVQARTHRVGITFDVQSFRYTSDSILSCQNKEDIERAFYFRPVGRYTDRNGGHYDYTEAMRASDVFDALASTKVYKDRVLNKGVSEEQARDLLPCNYRQHAVVSFNARSLMHFLAVRGNLDAQIEIQHLSHLMLKQALVWMPETFEWFKLKVWQKAKLAP